MVSTKTAERRSGRLSGSQRLRELESLYAALNQSQAVLEMDMQGIVLAANDNYLKMFGYTLSEIIGKTYAQFVAPSDRDGGDYRSLWEHLRQGQFEQGRFKRVGKDSREVWVRASFNPLVGSDGRPFKVVKLASEITQIIRDGRALDSAVHESQEVIQAVLRGEDDRRISVEGKKDNLLLLASSVNELINGVVATVSDASQAAQQAARGDLTARVKIEGRSGHFKSFAVAVNALIQSMLEVIANLSQTAGELQIGAAEISRGNLDLSRRTEAQAASLEQTASSMEEMSAALSRSADSAATANQLAEAAREQAERGSHVVASAVGAMSGIESASKKIADIIGVVDSIAFQTNLLALNAAVEAARAGEQGRGFAVVASEVRNLASRSASAAKDIRGLIHDSVQKVMEGTKLVDESGRMLEDIVVRAKKVTAVMAEIVNSSREQAAGIEQVNKAINSMDTTTQQNAALVEQASAAAQALSEQATSLKNLIARYHAAGRSGNAVSAAVDTREATRSEVGHSRNRLGARGSSR